MEDQTYQTYTETKTTDSTPLYTVQPKKKSNTWWIILLVVLLVLCCCVVIGGVVVALLVAIKPTGSKPTNNQQPESM